MKKPNFQDEIDRRVRPKRALVEAKIEEIRAIAPTMRKADIARIMNWDGHRFSVMTNEKWFRAYGISFKESESGVRPFADLALRDQLYADLAAGLSDSELMKKYAVARETIRLHRAKQNLPKKVQLTQPQIDRDEEIERGAELAATIRRNALIATSGDTAALVDWRAEFGRKSDGVHLMTISECRAEYVQALKGKCR